MEANRKYRVHTILAVECHSDYIKTRSVILRHQSINKGRYVLVPTTFEPGKTGDFLLRFFATSYVNLRYIINKKTTITYRIHRFFKYRELYLDAPKPSVWCCVTYPSRVTTVTVRKVTGLRNGDSFSRWLAYNAYLLNQVRWVFSGIDPYCIVTCEGKSVRSSVVRDAEGEAVWNFSAIFYRKNVNRPVLIEVQNK